MHANKSKKDAPQSNKPAGEESFEITYLRNKFLVSRQKVEEAMKASGNNRQLVEAYLTKYTTRKPILL
jgi:hypothetical protein